MVSVHKRYRTLIFTPVRRLLVVWDRYARFPPVTGILRWPHSVGGGECGRRKIPHEEPTYRYQTTSSVCSDGRRRQPAPPTALIGASETPRTWVKVLGLVEPWPRSLPMRNVNARDPTSNFSGHGVAHSSRKVSLQLYTVTDANALSGNEYSRTRATWNASHGTVTRCMHIFRAVSTTACIHDRTSLIHILMIELYINI